MRKQPCVFLSFLFVAFCVIFVAAGAANANWAQYDLCKAARALGNASARATIFAEVYGTRMPQEQLGAIKENLQAAANFLTEAEALFQEPFRTERNKKRIAATILRMIRNHIANLERISPKQRYHRINQIFNKYEQGIHYTFVSSRRDAYQWNANCDTQVFRTCFNFGKAEIAAASAGSRRPGFVDSYQGGANEQMRLAIQSGLAIALDEGAKPWDGHAKKICCGFGSPAEWASVPRFTRTSPLSDYLGFAGTLLKIIQDAAVGPGAPCWSGEALVCASGPGQAQVDTGRGYQGRFGGADGAVSLDPGERDRLLGR